ncbi:MAG: hypothetical protein A2V77_12920, partial [Anaeromyxobacter sp. RBG_16_69_14]
AAWQDGDLAPIPPDDLPPGLPGWMRSVEPWARRAGTTSAEKRATIAVTVPASALPSAAVRPQREAEATRLAGATREAEPAEVEGAEIEPEDAERIAARAGANGAATRRCALRGRLVTMDGKVIDDGVVWVANGGIEAVKPASAAGPAGFSGVEPLDRGGAIYPGFIDLHNHLAYGVLPLWNVPAAYTNRDDWKKHPQYAQLVKQPMAVLGKRSEMLPAICRYVECKALFGGVTTTQGIRLVNAGGITKYFRGIVRNVEMPDDPTLARGESRMPDVAASDLAAFWKTLQAQDAHKAAYLLHLAEGTDERARKHFLALHLKGDDWAIDRALDGIHCVALQKGDFETLAAKQGSMVWSPMSNLLLYGKTADVAAAKKAGVRIALGCDWSPSGSKNLLGEMKVAWILGKKLKVFGAEEVVAMVTRVASEVVRWDARLGTLAPGKLADLTVLTAPDADPYQGAIRATEAQVRLVVVGGVPRYGFPDLVRALVTPGEEVEDARVASQLRAIHLASADPLVHTIRFSEAYAILADALRDLPLLAEERSTPLTRALALRPAPQAGWQLALDEIEPTGVAMRPELTLRGRRTTPVPSRRERAGKPLPPVSIAIDAPTAAGDAAFWAVLAQQRNLPDYVKVELPPLYGEPRPVLHRKAAPPQRGQRGLVTAARVLSKRARHVPGGRRRRGSRR